MTFAELAATYRRFAGLEAEFDWVGETYRVYALDPAVLTEVPHFALFLRGERAFVVSSAIKRAYWPMVLGREISVARFVGETECPDSPALRAASLEYATAIRRARSDDEVVVGEYLDWRIEALAGLLGYLHGLGEADESAPKADEVAEALNYLMSQRPSAGPSHLSQAITAVGVALGQPK